MGLDMYLYLVENKDVEKHGIEEAYSTEVAYWRKANAIHRYFVEQDLPSEKEDHEPFVISEETAKSLLEIVTSILDKLEYETVTKKDFFGNDYEDYIVHNPQIAKKTLPTKAGFFFGSTDIDGWYVTQLIQTKEQLTEVLEMTNFDCQSLVYLAWY